MREFLLVADSLGRLLLALGDADLLEVLVPRAEVNHDVDMEVLMRSLRSNVCPVFSTAMGAFGRHEALVGVAVDASDFLQPVGDLHMS